MRINIVYRDCELLCAITLYTDRRCLKTHIDPPSHYRLAMLLTHLKFNSKIVAMGTTKGVTLNGLTFSVKADGVILTPVNKDCVCSILIFVSKDYLMHVHIAGSLCWY